MVEFLSNGHLESDRTSREYFEEFLKLAMKTSGIAFGVVAARAPEDFEDLRTLVGAKRNTNCGVSNQIDMLLDLIALDPDRDDFARRLPFYDDDIIIIMPPEPF